MVITHLKPHQVFVFGSNTEGRHGGGAARQALRWGAEYGRPRGHQGQTYAIVTKDLRRGFVGWESIAEELEELASYAAAHPDLEFLLTPIGTGLAGGKLEALGDLCETMDLPGNVILLWKNLDASDA